jgi:hypothetical protein
MKEKQIVSIVKIETTRTTFGGKNKSQPIYSYLVPSALYSIVVHHLPGAS